MASISALTASSQERMARIVISISFGSSHPRTSAPSVIISLEHPAANLLSLNFFYRLETSMSFVLLDGRIFAAAQIRPVSSSDA